MKKTCVKTDLRIGISGWTYPDWRGLFYPPKLPIKQELNFASRVFNSIEVNGTFYSLQKPHTFMRWYEETPDGFQFAVKAPQYITHEKRLNGVEIPVANFFASGILALKEKLGPILWQLPPNLLYDEARLEAFLNLLPHTTKQAALRGQNHSDWMKERSLIEVDIDRPLFHAIEVRHESFANPDFLRLLRSHNTAVVVGDTAGRWPLIEEKTGPIVYIRLHGDESLYPDGYTSGALYEWAEKIKSWSAECPTYAFLDNDHKTAAPLNARELMTLLSMNFQPVVIEPKPMKAAKRIEATRSKRRTIKKSAAIKERLKAVR